MVKFAGNGAAKPPANDKIALGDKHRVTDPALAPLANFTIEVECPFTGRDYGYSKRTHRFDTSYINPASYQISLDAGLGLSLGRDLNFFKSPTPAAVTVTVPKDKKPDENQNEIQLAPGGSGAPGGGGMEFVPDEILAYRWVISESSGTFTNSELVTRPEGLKHVLVERASFRVPRPGGYDIELNVVLRDGRQAESKTHFEFRDWFIVSIGDSAASGEGNPDEIGSTGLGGETVCRNTSISFGAGLKPNMANDPVWIEEKAHRSMLSGPALAARSRAMAEFG